MLPWWSVIKAAKLSLNTEALSDNLWFEVCVMKMYKYTLLTYSQLKFTRLAKDHRIFNQNNKYVLMQY